jgi:pimeloyl-ACP methyl ester carboxylesterase
MMTTNYSARSAERLFMASFVLVHGAFGGALSWRRLAPLLRQRGHDVFAPSLTGLGDRAHLGGPQTNLSTHIQDIVGIIEHWDLRDVVLVGHSYGGCVVSGVADRMPGRIAHLVYLDALLLKDGECAMDLEGSEQLRAMEVEAGWLLLLPDGPSTPRPPSRGHPLGTLEEELHLAKPLEEQPFTRTYVKAAEPPQPPPEEPQGNFWNAANRVRNDPAWRYAVVPGGHGMHREAPETVAGILLDLVRQEDLTPGPSPS